MDPDPDPGDPKTNGSDGSGSGTLVIKKKSSNCQNCIDKYLYDKMSTVILQLEKNERVSASGAWLVKKEKVQ
jgi:hypothetical protein